MLSCTRQVVEHLASQDKASQHDGARVWQHTMESLGRIHAVGLHVCLKNVRKHSRAR